MSKYLIILNPISGRGSGLQHKNQIESFFKSNNLDYELTLTEKPGHALELAENAVAQGFDIIVAGGGDGTCNEVLNGVLSGNSKSNHKSKMGVIPVGRGNDFAFSMGVPTDFDEACVHFINPTFKSIDVGKVTGGFFPDGRYFGNGVGIGFDAVVGFEALKLKFLTGFPSYVVAALKTIFLYYKAPQLQLELDDEQITNGFLMVSIMNGIRMGGGFYMAPKSDPADGKFSLCVVNELSKFATFPMILKFMKGTQEGDPMVRMLTSKKVKVTAINGSIPSHADGETVCVEGSSIDIQLIPGALELVV
jgi:YegS/Rv2252/BmrU family lipid kinase